MLQYPRDHGPVFTGRKVYTNAQVVGKLMFSNFPPRGYYLLSDIVMTWETTRLVTHMDRL